MQSCAEYVLVVSIKSKTNEQHRDPTVFVFGGGLGGGVGSVPSHFTQMRTSVIPHEGYDYTWKVSTSCTVYDTRSGRRMLVASASADRDEESDADTVNYKSACSADSLLAPLYDAVSDVVSQVKDEMKWREYREAIRR